MKFSVLLSVFLLAIFGDVQAQTHKYDKNAYLHIDCSPYSSSYSYLNRAVKKRNKTANNSSVKKNAKFLHSGDYLKIYLFNLNPYQYNVEVNDVQQDFEYGKSEFDYAAYNKSGNGSTDQNPVSENAINVAVNEKAQIINYANAVDQLNFFIQKTKANLNPNEQKLISDKKQLEEDLNLASMDLNPNFEKLWEKIDSITKLDLASIYEKAKKFPAIYVEFNSLSYRFTSSLLPIQIKSYDQLTITVKISKKSNGSKVFERNYTYKIIGGLKVDQSFGIGVNGLYDDQHYFKEVMVKDTTFGTDRGIVLQSQDSLTFGQDSILKIENVSKKQILPNANRDSSQFSIGITTLTHFYYRLGFVNFGPQIGISVDIFPEQNTRYLFGGSIMLNDGRHRVSLDAGWSFGKVKKLHPAYQVGDLIASSNTSFPEITITRKSWYFGISYNVPITSRVEQADAPKK